MRVLLLLLIVVLVASYLWWSRARRGELIVAAKGAGGLPPDIERWFEAGLLTHEQADAIVSFEESRIPERKVSVSAEAIGYIGAVLALAGGAAAVEQVWEDLSNMAHVGILAAATLVTFVGGWLIRAQKEPAIQRMMSVLWFLSVGGMAATMALLFVDIVELSEDALAFTIGGIGAIYAALLWLSHRRVLQVVALFGTGLAAAVGAMVILPGEPATWSFSLLVWVYGALWLLLGWKGVVIPQWAAMALGSVFGSYGPSIAAGEYGWLLGVGLVSAVLLMAFGMSGRQLPLLAIGSVAAFGYLTASVVRYFGDTLGVPTALSLIGLLVLALAVWIGRTGTFQSGGWRHPGGHPAG